MSTLAEQFHDSFEPYYAGKKKPGWTEQKAELRPESAARKPEHTEQERILQEEAATESRH